MVIDATLIIIGTWLADKVCGGLPWSDLRLDGLSVRRPVSRPNPYARINFGYKTSSRRTTTIDGRHKMVTIILV